jgi:predicted transcriptional regulator
MFMEISVKLPENLYRDVSHLAKTQNKSVKAVIKGAVQTAVEKEVIDLDEQKDLIKQSIKFCTDKEVLALAKLTTRHNQRLEYLFEKNREGVLTKSEHIELTKAVEQSRLNDIRKAFGIVEAKKRGLLK